MERARHLLEARALLRWTQDQLSEAAQVHRSEIGDLELDIRSGRTEAIAAFTRVLEEAGVRFEADGPKLDRPTPAFAAKPEKQPIRWIEASDLIDWANRRAGQDGLPELLSRLLRAEHGAYLSLRFPSADSVSQTGWDGRSWVQRSGGVAPVGQSGWELGVTSGSVKGKADQDYANRIKDPDSLAPSETTFVFVTPRRWSRGKAKWLKDKRAEKIWKEVVALDADDLVHWIECYPAVGAWLATRVGKRPPGVSSLAEVWDQWSGATLIPLSTELTRLDRDLQAIDLLRWLDAPPSPHVVQADSLDEALGFAFAVLDMLPDHDRRALESRVLVVDAAAGERLAESLTPLILVLRDGDYSLAAQLVRKGHHVYLALGPDADAPSSAVHLALPRHFHLQQALINMGLDRHAAENMAHDAGRSTTTLRRMMPPAPGRRPQWALGAPTRAVIAALLVGGWNEASPGDRCVLEAIAGMTYDELVRSLSPLLAPLDSPLRRAETAWRLKSPRDAWGLFAAHVTSADIDRFLAQFATVCAEIDPVYHLPAADRWLAAIKEVRPEHSGLIRQAMADTLALLANFGDQARLTHDVKSRAAQAVRTVLTDLSREACWSLAPLFRKFAEASPTGFLDSLEAALSQTPSPLLVLFEGETGNGSAFARITETSWALDALAWSPKHLLQVCRVLARLDGLDPGGKNAARPIESLRDVFLSWSPQTNASWVQRRSAIDFLRRSFPDVAWRVMLSIPPEYQSICLSNAYPRWLPEAEGPGEVLTDEIIAATVAEVGERLVEDVGADVGRWRALIDTLRRLFPETRIKAGRMLLEQEPNITDPAQRDDLRGEVRKLLQTHAQFADASWAIPEVELIDFQVALERLEPTDLVWRHAWLFSNGKGGLGLPELDWAAGMEEQRLRQDLALAEIIGHQGHEGVNALLQISSRPQDVGASLARIDIAQPLWDSVVYDGLLAEDGPLWDAARNVIGATMTADARQGVADWINRVAADDAPHRARRRLLLMLPGDRQTWTYAASLGEAVEQTYWENAPYWNFAGDRADLEFALDRLVERGRLVTALRLIARHQDAHLDAARIIAILKQAATTPGAEKDTEADQGGQRWLRLLPELFEHLDKRDDVSDDDVATLEWIYFKALRHTTRPARVIGRQLAANPAFFLTLLKLVFDPDETSNVEEPIPGEHEHERLQQNAWQGFSVLDEWWWLPGADAEGVIDGPALIAWIDAVRDDARTCGRLRPADRAIGKVLSKARTDKDRPWPPEAVCRALEHVGTNELADSFLIGTMNRRGVTTRMPSDGGRLERREADAYRAHARHWEIAYPFAASLLVRVAENYESRGQREDDTADQYGWA